MWECWQKGQSQEQIAQLFDRNHSSIQCILVESGGIMPRQRCRSERALSLAEREEISRGVVSGRSVRAMAVLLGRAPSTVSRELRRNGGRSTEGAVSLADVDPRQGTRRASALHVGDRHPSLLLRSAASLAARFEREYQWTVEAVFSEGRRSLRRHTSQAQCRGQTAERATEENARLRNTG